MWGNHVLHGPAEVATKLKWPAVYCNISASHFHCFLPNDLFAIEEIILLTCFRHWLTSQPSSLQPGPDLDMWRHQGSLCVEARFRSNNDHFGPKKFTFAQIRLSFCWLWFSVRRIRKSDNNFNKHKLFFFS